MSSHRKIIARSQEVEYTYRSSRNKKSYRLTPSKRTSTSPKKQTTHSALVTPTKPFPHGPLFSTDSSMEPISEYPDAGDFVTEPSKKKTKVLPIPYLNQKTNYSA